MKIAIRYFTKSKKGNTEKLAEKISEAVGVESLEVSRYLNEKVDRLFLVNAMYAASIDPKVKDFLSSNRDRIGEVVNFSTSASGKSTWGLVKKECDALGIRISEKEFHCAASWIFINKGLPSEKDYEEAGRFAASMTEFS